jgi:hypothetical protein
MPIRVVLRDLVWCALTKQAGVPVTTGELAGLLTEYGCGDLRQVGKALRQLEAHGHAVCAPARPGYTASQWTAAPVSPCAAAGRCDAAAPGTR